MVVYILTDYVSWSRLTQLQAMIPANCGYPVTVVNNMNNLDINKDTIISTSVEGQYHIFGPIVKTNIYGILDDKINYFNYLENDLDLMSGILLIPSYNHSYNGPSITKQFLIKHRNGWSGKFNTLVNDNVYNLIKQYGDTHHIQDVINIKHVYAVSISVLYGKILGAYSYKSNEGLTPQLNAHGFSAVRGNCVRDPRVRSFLKKIVKKMNFQGIAEFEFLIDTNDQLYFMECNARISGSLRVQLFFDNVIKPYINALKTRQFNEINMDDEKLWVEYK